VLLPRRIDQHCTTVSVARLWECQRRRAGAATVWRVIRVSPPRVPDHRRGAGRRL